MEKLSQIFRENLTNIRRRTEGFLEVMGKLMQVNLNDPEANQRFGNWLLQRESRSHKV